MLKKFLFLIFITLNLSANTKPTLIIYTIDSFASDWAVGNKIKKKFEESCNCKIQYVTLSDSKSLLARLKLEKHTIKADLIIGLDSNDIESVKQLKILDKLAHNNNYSALPIPWDDEYFMPYNYGILSFIYDKSRTQPIYSFEELLEKDLTIIITDPRSCTTGLNLIAWVKNIYQKDSNLLWQKLIPKITTVTKSWYEAYNLFLRKEADLVISYTTSPIYHIKNEKNHNFQALIFKEGNYLQIEVAAKTLKKDNEVLSKKFLEYLLQNESQNLMLEDNYMLPVIKQNNFLLDKYLLPASKVLYQPSHIVNKNLKNWIKEWLNSF